jgi:hypothetical protein
MTAAVKEIERAHWFAELLLRALPESSSLEEALEATSVALAVSPERPSIQLAHDVFSPRIQKILDRARAEMKKFSRAAYDDLKRALDAPTLVDIGRKLIDFIRRYRDRLTTLFGQTALAALVEGALEIAELLPPIPLPGLNVPIPPSLGPVEAVRLLDRLRGLPESERAPEVYKLPPAEQEYVKVALLDVYTPATFVPLHPEEEVFFPAIDEGVRALQARNLVTRVEYDRLDEAAKQKAFTIASVESRETLEKIRGILVDAVEGKVDLKGFRERVLEEVGEGTFLSEAHEETIYRTMVQSAYSDGQMKVLQHPYVRSGFPYVRYTAIDDSRVRPEHLAMEKHGIDGTAWYRIDDPVFQLFRPPWSWNCVPWYSQIYTDRGLLPISEVRVGDLVLTHRSRFRRVSGTYRREGISELVAVQLESGALCRATGEHRFFTKRGWVEASLLNVFDEVYQIENATAPYLIVLKVDDGLQAEDFDNGLVSIAIGASGIFLNFDADRKRREVEVKPKWKGLLVEHKFDTPLGECRSECLLVTAHTDNAVKVHQWISPDRFAAARDHLRTNLGTTGSTVNPILSSDLFDSLRVRSVMDRIGLSNRAQRDTSACEKPLERPIGDSCRSGDVSDTNLLLKVVRHDRLDTAGINRQTCLGLVEVSGITFWLFPHNCNCSPVCSKIKSVSRFSWGHPVYNLAVEEDESYLCDRVFVHNCRCGYLPATIRQAAEAGVKEASEWVRTGIEPSPPAFVAIPPFQPPADFRAQFPSVPLSLALSLGSLLDEYEAPVVDLFDAEIALAVQPDVPFEGKGGRWFVFSSKHGRVIPTREPGKAEKVARERAAAREEKGAARLKIREEKAAAHKKEMEERAAARQKAREEKEAARARAREEAKVARVKAAEEAKKAGFEAARKILADPLKTTMEDVKKVGESLLVLKLDELKELKKTLGLKGGQTKGDIVARIKEEALAKIAAVAPPVAAPTPGTPPPTPEQQKAIDDYQQHGTKAASFKAWFGDWETDAANSSKVVKSDGTPDPTKPASRVVDEKGVPITVYHGTPWKEFEVFDKAKLADPEALLYGGGFYFTSSEEVAGSYRKQGSGIVPLPQDQEQAELKVSKLKAVLDIKKALRAEIPRLKREYDQAAQANDDARNVWLSKDQATDPVGYSEAHRAYIKSAEDASEASRKYNYAKWWGAPKSNYFTSKIVAARINSNKGQLREIIGNKLDAIATIKEGGTLFRAYLNIRKPFDAKTGQIDASTLPASLSRRINQNLGANYTYFTWKNLHHALGSKKAANDLLASLGYDGLTHEGQFGARAGVRVAGVSTHRVWIAFEPSQIKAVGNRGTFDPGEANIKLSLEDEQPTPLDYLQAMLEIAEEGERDENGYLRRRPHLAIRSILKDAIELPELLKNASFSINNQKTYRVEGRRKLPEKKNA